MAASQQLGTQNAEVPLQASALQFPGNTGEWPAAESSGSLGQFIAVVTAQLPGGLGSGFIWN